MVDFHSHILPNIDDGSKSIEETFNLIKEAQNAGFDGIISTSHYIENYYEVNEYERGTWLNAIAQKLPNTNLFLASEVYMTHNVISLLESRQASTINGTSYILFEMPMNNEPMSLYDFIYTLQENKLVPILAHPERYSFIQQNPNLVYELIQKGVLMQMNYGSILGQYGDKAGLVARKLLENNMVHFLGTDVHREKTIYPKIPEILEKIEGITGKEKLEEITTINPKLVLCNKEIDISRPTEIKLSLKEKLQLKKKNKS